VKTSVTLYWSGTAMNMGGTASCRGVTGGRCDEPAVASMLVRAKDAVSAGCGLSCCRGEKCRRRSCSVNSAVMLILNRFSR
jgi:hypothetical protein